MFPQDDLLAFAQYVDEQGALSADEWDQIATYTPHNICIVHLYKFRNRDPRPPHLTQATAIKLLRNLIRRSFFEVIAPTIQLIPDRSQVPWLDLLLEMENQDPRICDEILLPVLYGHT